MARPSLKSRMSALLVSAAVSALMTTSAAALDFGVGVLPIAVEPRGGVALSESQTISVRGAVSGSSPVTVILRVDDRPSPGYEDRANLEYTLAPGPFLLEIPVASLTTPSGRTLNPGKIVRVILFDGDDSGRVEVDAFSTDQLEAPSYAPPARPAAAEAPLEFATGRGDVEESWWRGVDLSGYGQILVEGIAHGDGPVDVVLRIDDASSDGYASRYNLEQSYPPGAFRFRVPIDGLRTPDGRALDPNDIRQAMVFVWGDGDVTITRFAALPRATLPGGARGYAFGGVDTPLAPGFERVTYNDPRLEGRDIMIMRRPNPDPLIATGLTGVRVARLPAPPGPARVTIWAEDPGEWEWLPHPLRRRIAVNGRVVLDDATTAFDWVRERYLAGKYREHDADDDAWTAFGQHRGRPISVDVEVGENGVIVQMLGDSRAASHLSAVLIQPLSGPGAVSDPTAAMDYVIERRAEWYRDLWPVNPEVIEPVAVDAVLRVDAEGGAVLTAPDGAPLAAVEGVLAPGTGVRLTLEVVSERAAAAPALRLVAPQAVDGATLEAQAWAALWKLERVAVNSPQLRLADDTLISDMRRAPLEPGRPRRIEIWVSAPEEAQPGRYQGAVVLQLDGQTVAAPMALELLDVTLPPAPEPAGFYLTYAPHLDFFPRTALDRDRQAVCDLRTLADFGLAGSAPPINRPDPTNLKHIVSDVRRGDALGVAPGWLAYNPMRPLRDAYGPERAAQLMGRVLTEIETGGLTAPFWSAADEPSNPDQSVDVRRWVDALRTAAPGIRLAGHLNTPSDTQFVSLFDVVIINAGFGLDVERIAETARAEREVWIYNSFRPRATAGLWLWRTDASRYVQWHARMPTADPFDPIDGREGDVQVLLPTAEPCAPQPDIDRDLLRMAEGLVDQRWLVWLTARAESGDAAAQALQDSLVRRLGGSWDTAAAFDEATLDAIRADITALARRP